MIDDLNKAASTSTGGALRVYARLMIRATDQVALILATTEFLVTLGALSVTRAGTEHLKARCAATLLAWPDYPDWEDFAREVWAVTL